MSIYGIPFNEEKVRNDGASSLEEFKDWVTEYGQDFLYSIPTPQNGDIIVFAWIGKDEWFFVGDAIVKQNHKTGSERWCGCTKESGYPRHIITGGVRTFPRPVSSKRIKSLKLGRFTKITPDVYQQIVKETVVHWQ